MTRMADVQTWNRRIARRAAKGGRGKTFSAYLGSTTQGWGLLTDATLALMLQRPDPLAIRAALCSDDGMRYYLCPCIYQGTHAIGCPLYCPHVGGRLAAQPSRCADCGATCP